MNIQIYFSSKPSHPLNTAPNHVGRPRLSVRRPIMRSYNALSGQGAQHAATPALPPDKVLVTKEGKLIIKCCCVEYV